VPTCRVKSSDRNGSNCAALPAADAGDGGATAPWISPQVTVRGPQGTVANVLKVVPVDEFKTIHIIDKVLMGGEWLVAGI